MPAEHDDSWELGSGFALDGATVTIVAMEFAPNAIFGGNLCAEITFLNEDTGEEIPQSFTVGANFDVNREGDVLEGTGKINKNTRYGIFLQSVKEVLEDPRSIVGEATEAAGWIGTRWAMGSVEKPVMNPTTKVMKDSTMFIVTEYLGMADEEPEPEPVKPKPTGRGAARTRAGAAKASTATSPPTRTRAKGGNTARAEVGDKLWDQLVELANDAEDHDTFIDAALALDEVDGNRVAQAAVVKTGAGSVWAARTAE